MMWQTWTAFGIMIGYVMDLAFQNVPDRSGIRGLNWRLMLGSVSNSGDLSASLPRLMGSRIGRRPRAVHRGASLLLSRVASLVHDEGTVHKGVWFSPPA